MARKASAGDDEIFTLRLNHSAPDLWPMLETLYGHRSDYQGFRDRLLDCLRAAWKARPAALRHLDLQRDLEPDWFQPRTVRAMSSTSTASPERWRKWLRSWIICAISGSATFT